ncbi:hypothetical protein RvY_00578 [Ramazzottius varieornatus]|uniref:RIIa domain-containing protein n=1 Tax=Ramazzottius varieornatus TaxID=947166 RepID=A0A1D1UGW3_RAMVA|nr:hypothetical protein RvY_00578 [Ramazzottius varieornatus]
MEDYVKQHDLMRLFERLATSIMYDRPEDLNQYAADWLTKIKNGRPQIEHVPSSVSLGSRASGSSSVKSKSNTSVPETLDSVLTQDSQNSLHSTRSKGFRPGRVSDSQSKVVVELGNGKEEGIRENPENLDPYIFSPENIPIFYGMLDPLGEGFIALQHFKEGRSQAFSDDLEDLQKYSGELPEVILPEENVPQEQQIVPQLLPDSEDTEAEQQEEPEDPEEETGEDDEAEEDAVGGTTSAGSLPKSSRHSMGSRTSVSSKTSSSAVKPHRSSVAEKESEGRSELTAKIP